MKKIRLIILAAAFAGCLIQHPSYCQAAEVRTAENAGNGALTVEGTVSTDGEYTVIRVNAEDDGSGPLLYAIDSDAPEAFGTSREFTVKKGSEHTVYVKDAAGNISGQVYRVPDAEMDMEVNIGYSDTSSAAMMTDEERAAVEAGGGNVAEQVITDTGDTAERQFFTITTKNEHVFYIMVDQSRSENNVYLLDQVTDADLLDLAAGETQKDKASVFAAKEEKATVQEPMLPEPDPKAEKSSGSKGDLLLLAAVILLGAGALYYYKIYKPKQENQKEYSDAKDLDEFESEEEMEEGEALDFTVSREEKDALMEKILNGDDFEEESELFTEEELGYDPDQEESEYVQELETEEPEELEIPEEDEE